jgi:curved DNA-binding protein CbpA
LGASPSDDAARLKNAFRKAVKANHPDLHPHDPGAALRLSGIVRAYAILRDEHERTSYDHALRVEAAPPCAKPRRRFVGIMGHVLTEAVAVATMAVVLGGGYALFTNVMAQISNDRKTAELAGPPDHAAVEPAGHAAARAYPEHELPRDEVVGLAPPSVVIAPSASTAAVKSSEGVKIAGLVPSLPEHEIAKLAGDSGTATDRLDAKTGQLKRDPDADRPHQDQQPSAGSDAPAPARVELSALESNNNISKPAAPEITIPDQKPKPLRKSADAKPAEFTPHEKQRAAAPRPPASHPPVKQASLEGKTVPPPCSQACPGSAPPPLLGVGF